MLLFERNRVLFRAIAVFTLLGMCPSTFGASYYLTPAVVQVAYAVPVEGEEEAAEPPAENGEGDASEVPAMYTQVQQMWSEASTMDPAEALVRYAAYRPVRLQSEAGEARKAAQSPVQAAIEAEAAKQESADSEAEPAQVAQTFEEDFPESVEPAQEPEQGEQPPAENLTPAMQLVAEADAYRAQGHLAEAAQVYASVATQFPSEFDALMASYNNLKAMAIQSGPEGVSTILAAIPAANQLNHENEYAVLGSLLMHLGRHYDAIGENETARIYFSQSIEICRQFMWSIPESALQIITVSHYAEASEILGPEAEKAAEDELDAAIATLPPSMSRFAALYSQGYVIRRADREMNERTLLMSAMLNEYANHSHVREALASEAVLPLAKAYIEYALAYGAYALGEPSMALQRAERLDGTYADSLEVDDQAGYLRAHIIADLNRDDPYVGILAYTDYLERATLKIFRRHAALEIAKLYERGRDYVQAMNYYEGVMAEYPGSEVAIEAQRSVDYINAHVVDTYDVAMAPAETAGDTNRTQVALTAMCGPIALRYLLASSGVRSDLQDLVLAAGTTDAGTSMQGLIEAARRAGRPLAGVASDKVESFAAPYILHTQDDHFVFVEFAQNGFAIVSDTENYRRLLPVDELQALSSGKALIASDAKTPLLAMLGQSDLQATFGSGVLPDVVPIDNCPSDSPPGTCKNCKKNALLDMNDAEHSENCLHARAAKSREMQLASGERAASPDIRLANAGGLSPTAPHVSGTAGVGEGGPAAIHPIQVGGASVHSYVDLATMEVVIQDDRIAISDIGGLGYGFSDLDLGDERLTNEGDLSMGKGPMRFSSGAVTASNPCDTDPTNWPYDSIMKLTTVDSYGRVRIAAGPTWCSLTESVPTVSLDIDGDSDNELAYTGTPSNEIWSVDQEEHRVLVGGSTRFTGDGHGCVANVDVNGNSIDYERDGSGRITKVYGSDGRSVNYTFDGSSRLSTVVLKKSSTTLYSLEYTYTTNARSIEFNGDSSNTVHYEYNGNGDITSYTDAEGNETTFAYTYSGPDIATVYVYYPDGSEEAIDKNNLTVTVLHDDGVGTVGKTQYILDAELSRRVVEIKRFLDISTAESWKYYYTVNGDLEYVVRPNNSTYLTLTYTAPHELDSVTVAGEDPTEYVFASTTKGNLVDAVVMPDGTTWDYIYDGSYNLTKVTHPSLGSNGMQYRYDGYGRMTNTILPLGGSPEFVYTYNAYGKVSTVTDPDSNVTTYQYDDFGNVTKVIDPLSHETVMTYGLGGGCSACGASMGLVSSIEDDLGNTTEFEYDKNGNMVLVTDASNFDTVYEYDTMNRLTRIEPQTGGTEPYQTMAYDIFGILTSTTDYEGVVRAMEYDWKGRMTKESDGEGWTKYSYTSEDQLYQVTVGEGMGSGTTLFTHTYTGSLRLDEIVDAVSKKVKYTYDVAGRLTKVGGGTGGTYNETHYLYNGTTGQLSKVQYEYGPSSASYDEVTYAYDAMGRLSTMTDWISSLGGNTPLAYEYDVHGRITTITDYDGEELTYVYDDAGRLTSMTDYHGATTTYAYYTNNRLSTLTAPGSKTWTYTYNALGQPTQVVLPNGMATVYGYDGRNRLSLINHKDAVAGSSVASYSYTLDKTGNIDGITELDGTVWDYAYDDRYRLISAVRTSGANDGILAQYAYTYDERDNMLTKVAPFEDDFNDGNSTGWAKSGTWVSSGYTMISATPATAFWRYFYIEDTEPDTEIQFSYCNRDTSNAAYRCNLYMRREYGTTDSLRVMFYPGSAELQQYDNSTFTTLDTDTAADSIEDVWYDVRVLTDGANVEVWWGERGEQMTKILETASTTVAVTNQYRFEIAPYATVEFDNIRIIGDGLTQTTTFAVNNANEMTSMTDVNGTTTFAYDGWGRMESKSRGSHAADYGFRYGHFLASYDTNFPDEGDVEYVTGGDGKRRVRTAGVDVTGYRWAGMSVISEEDGTGTLTRTYIERNMAHSDGSNAASGTYAYYTRDRLGSTRSLYDQSKALAGSFEYSPYGAFLQVNNSNATTHLYSGHDFDVISALHFAPFRHYSSSLARWEKRDPLGIMAGLNEYAYVRGNPILRMDSLGLYDGVAPNNDRDCFDTCDALLGAMLSGCIAAYRFRMGFIGLLNLKYLRCETIGDVEERRRCEDKIDREIDEWVQAARDLRDACYDRAMDKYEKCLEDCPKDRVPKNPDPSDSAPDGWTYPIPPDLPEWAGCKAW